MTISDKVLRSAKYPGFVLAMISLAGLAKLAFDLGWNEPVKALFDTFTFYMNAFFGFLLWAPNIILGKWGFEIQLTDELQYLATATSASLPLFMNALREEGVFYNKTIAYFYAVVIGVSLLAGQGYRTANRDAFPEKILGFYEDPDPAMSALIFFITFGVTTALLELHLFLKGKRLEITEGKITGPHFSGTKRLTAMFFSAGFVLLANAGLGAFQ